MPKGPLFLILLSFCAVPSIARGEDQPARMQDLEHLTIEELASIDLLHDRHEELASPNAPRFAFPRSVYARSVWRF